MVVYQSFYCIFFPLLEAVMSRLWVPQTTDSSTSVSRFFVFPRLLLYLLYLLQVIYTQKKWCNAFPAPHHLAFIS